VQNLAKKCYVLDVMSYVRIRPVRILQKNITYQDVMSGKRRTI